MLGKFILFVVIVGVRCDWVKLPELSSIPEVSHKILNSGSPVKDWKSRSDVMSSIFSYDAPKIITSTTEKNFATQPSHPTQVKKYFPATVTSKTLEILPKVTGRTESFDDHEPIMELIKLPSVEMSTRAAIRKFILANHTMSMAVLPEQDPAPSNSSNLETDHEDEDDDEEGVTVLVDDESLDMSEEEVYADEDEYYEYNDELETPPAPSTTTKAPAKSTTRKASQRMPIRRIIQFKSGKQKKPHALTFMSFLRFLQNIQESFATRTAKNITDKIKMLSEFRDSLLKAINKRIKSLWKTQSKTNPDKEHKRTRRTLSGGGGGGWMEHSSGSMDFPSAEGALLSISFLTFAVFLIKLVLQVIKTIKMKKYNMMSTNMNNVESANVIIKRHRSTRDISFSEPNDISIGADLLAYRSYFST